MTDSGTHNGFEPEITAFTCIYCGAMAADTAGIGRIAYPANVKVIRLPCTGKVDVRYLLQAFEQGADGVYVVACPVGNCHHEQGNVRAAKRIEYTQSLLEQIGLEKDRLNMYHIGAAEGQAFAQAAREMTERVRALGPSPLKRRAE